MERDNTKAKSYDLAFYGAGGGGRTRTVSLPLDFESSTSANSITPALLGHYSILFSRNQGVLQKNLLKISEKYLDTHRLLWYHDKVIYPWLSWIARKTPTLEVAGSNPVG